MAAVNPSSSFSGVPAFEHAPEIREMIGQGRYKKAVNGLIQKIRDKSQPKAVRYELMLDLAEFYETHVGDLEKSRRWLKKIPVDSALKDFREKAGQRLDRLGRLDQKYPEMNGLVFEAKSRAIRPGSGLSKKEKTLLKQDLRGLNRAIKEHPEYHLIHELHYLAGLIHLKLGHPLRADRSFSKALSIKPALFLFLPVQRLSLSARSQWTRSLGRGAALGVSLGLILALGLGFALARPWQWLKFSHILTGAAAGIVWTGLFWAGQNLLGGVGIPEEMINRDNFYPPPVYVDFRPGSPGSQPAGVLFGYGSILLAGTFFFCVFTGRMRKRGRALGLNLLFACLAASSVLTLFYFDHCDFKSRFYPGKQGPGYFAFRIAEPEPFLLTNPTAYPVIELDSIDDPELVKWLKRYQKNQ